MPLSAGGRTSSRQQGGFSFDHGAQFMRVGPQAHKPGDTAEATPGLVRLVAEWVQAGTVTVPVARA